MHTRNMTPKEIAEKFNTRSIKEYIVTINTMLLDCQNTGSRKENYLCDKLNKCEIALRLLEDEENNREI